MTSTKTQLPYEYYSLPFCKPEGDLQYNTLNLGWLVGWLVGREGGRQGGREGEQIIMHIYIIIESDSISRDEQDSP